MSKEVLHIEDLHVSTGENEIIKGLNLKVNKGEVHAIMGPNGSGKSTLANTIVGKSDYEVTKGDIKFFTESLLDKSVDERASLGCFLAFQYPVEIPGLNNAYFLRAALNAQRKNQGKESIDAHDFLILIKSHLKKLSMDEKFLHRAVNDAFSGGEKKRNEILQMSLLEPRLCILDETDSGLDIDALKVCAQGVSSLRNSERAMIVVTHYQRLLNHIKPDFVHVMVNGRIVKSGDASLALSLEEEGYDGIIKEQKLKVLES